MISVIAAGGCIDRPAPTARARDAATPVALAEPALEARLRRWALSTQGAEPWRDAVIAPAHDHDTAQVRCARLTPRGAPDALNATRLVCVGPGDEVLAGEAGFARYLALHQFDAALAVPAARVLIELRDEMVGMAGRSYSRVDARAEGGKLLVDAEGSVRSGAGAAPVPGRWHFTIQGDGTTAETPGP